MSNRRFTVLAIIAVVVVALGGVIQVRRGEGQQAPVSSAAAAEERRAVPVETAAVERRPMERALTYHGVLLPSRTVRLALLQGGRVETVEVDVGDQVEPGDVLLRLDTDELRAHLRQGEAGVAVATARLEQLLAGATAEELRQLRASVAQAEAELDNARQEYERTQRLFESGAATGQAYDAARTRLRAAESAVDAATAQLERVQKGASEQDIATAEAQLRQAEAARDLSQVHLDNATLKSPIQGTVTERSVEPGEMASPGQPVITVAGLDELRVSLRVSGRDVVDMTTGAPARVVVEDLPYLTYEGRIHRIDPVADPQSNLFRVDVRVPNEDGALRGGLYAAVHIPLTTGSPVLAVPERAVAEWDGEPGVFTVEGGQVRFVPVQFGFSDGRWREVTGEAELKEGQAVITSGREFVRPGASVRVREAAPAVSGEGRSR